MKACCVCGAQFEPTGNGCRCLPCRLEYDRSWRARRKAEGRPVKSTSMPRDYHKKYEEAYYANPDVKARRAKQAQERYRNPDHKNRILARTAVHNALRRGEIKRMPCEVCGADKVDAHHDDYSRPTDVRWLCRMHHVELHTKAEAA